MGARTKTTIIRKVTIVRIDKIFGLVNQIFNVIMIVLEIQEVQSKPFSKPFANLTQTI